MLAVRWASCAPPNSVRRLLSESEGGRKERGRTRSEEDLLSEAVLLEHGSDELFISATALYDLFKTWHVAEKRKRARRYRRCGEAGQLGQLAQARRTNVSQKVQPISMACLSVLRLFSSSKEPSAGFKSAGLTLHIAFSRAHRTARKSVWSLDEVI